MDKNSCLLKLNKVYESLEDKESRDIFEARLSFVFDRNQIQYEDRMLQIYNDFYCNELEQSMKKINAKGIIIFGCGKNGKRLKENLFSWGYKVDYFCDNDDKKIGNTYDNIPIIPPDEVVKNYRSYLVVISSSLYAHEMEKELLAAGLEKTNILIPIHKVLIAGRGTQYFDVFQAKPNEVFLDCGGYNGDTVIDFLKWTDNSYKKIMVLEPMKEMSMHIKKRLAAMQIKNVEILNNAAWNREEEIAFIEDGAGSRKDDRGKIYVKGINIDSFAPDATFIKMDIEGSELKALKGAELTIRNNRPRLAICIYHRPEDIYEIGAYLLELVPEYRFVIRQYASNMWETVLYAFI